MHVKLMGPNVSPAGAAACPVVHKGLNLRTAREVSVVTKLASLGLLTFRDLALRTVEVEQGSKRCVRFLPFVTT